MQMSGIWTHRVQLQAALSFYTLPCIAQSHEAYFRHSSFYKIVALCTTPAAWCSSISISFYWSQIPVVEVVIIKVENGGGWHRYVPAANECPLHLQLTSGRISPTNGFTSPVRISLLLHLGTSFSCFSFPFFSQDNFNRTPLEFRSSSESQIPPRQAYIPYIIDMNPLLTLG